MWSFVFTTFNALSYPNLIAESARLIAAQPTINQEGYKDYSNPGNLAIAQTSNVVEAVSPLGYSLKYSSDWQKFNSPNSDPNWDIFISKSFSNSQEGFFVTITTTIMDYIGLPTQIPENVKKIDIAAEAYAGILSQSGYKILQKNETTINERKAIRLVTENPQKNGSIIVLIEGKREKMIVSTSLYPLDSSVVSQELMEQIVKEIDLIQNSITVR